MVISVLVGACGKKNQVGDNGGINSINPTGTLPIQGNNLAGAGMDQKIASILSEIPCTSGSGQPIGANRYTFSYRVTGGQFTPVAPTSLNFNNVSGVYVGRTTVGDVLVFRDYGNQTADVIFNVCPRSYIANYQPSGITPQGSVIYSTSRMCTVLQIAAATVSMTFNSQMGPIPEVFSFRPLEYGPQRVSACQM